MQPNKLEDRADHLEEAVVVEMQREMDQQGWEQQSHWDRDQTDCANSVQMFASLLVFWWGARWLSA